MSLTITKKASKDTSGAFRQVEEWANSMWAPLIGLNPFWTPFGAGYMPQYFIDGFGFIHLRGVVQTTVPVTTGTTYPVFTLASGLTLINHSEFFIVAGGNTGTVVLLSGSTLSITAANTTNPYVVSLSGIAYTRA